MQIEVQRFWQDIRRVHSLVFDSLLAKASAYSRFEAANSISVVYFRHGLI